MSQPGGPRRLVLWFRNDLRLHDNPMVSSALQKLKSKEVDDVVPVYCLDARFFKATSWGNLKTGAHRAKFLLESAQDLKQSLKALGSDLLVTVGLPEEVIAGVAQGSSSCSVLTTQEVTSEETAVDAKVARAIKPWSGQVIKVWGSTLFHLEDAAASMGPGGIRTMPDVFTPFKDKVEKRCQVRKEVPAPKAGELPLPKSVSDAAGAPIIPASAVYAGPSAAPFDLAARLAAFPQWGELPWPKGAVPTQPAHDARGVMPFKGGETAALARLKHYLWDSDCIASYFDTRNGMLGPDYSTKLAPWLSAGCISPRTIYHQIKKYEAQRVSNKSTYWVIFELIWRDFFRFFALKHGNKIFFEGGTSDTPLMWSSDPELWQRWRDGKTGLPLVDANMRELAATGWMSNRGRQNVASYLVLDLGVDWRRGADYFESVLLDYDVCSNWGNWVAMAGLTGGRVNHFNIAKQSKDYDPDGEYIRHWIPELKNVPTSRIHEPWLMGKDEMVKYGVQIGSDYPSPIPASKHARPHGGGGGGSRFGGGGGRGSGSGGYSGGGRGSASGGRPSSGRPAPGRQRQAKMSEFERFG